MTYAERIKRIAHTLDELIIDGLSQKSPEIEEDMALVLTNEITKVHDIAIELDETPRAPDEGPLELITAFPFAHPDDRENRRLALYDKPCTSGDGSGEFIIWAEVREPEHDGYREAARFNGVYTGYVGAVERDAAYYNMLDKFSYKCARIVGPFVPEKNRGYRRSN